MDYHDNPILKPAFADRDRILSSISTPKPAEPSKPKVPPAITKMILELGLRYRPSEKADLINHTTMVGLLAQDLADVPPSLLKIAISRWVGRSPFMPKASDLIELARDVQARSDPERQSTRFPGPFTVDAYAEWANQNFPKYGGKDRYRPITVDGKKALIDA